MNETLKHLKEDIENKAFETIKVKFNFLRPFLMNSRVPEPMFKRAESLWDMMMVELQNTKEKESNPVLLAKLNKLEQSARASAKQNKTGGSGRFELVKDEFRALIKANYQQKFERSRQRKTQGIWSRKLQGDNGQYDTYEYEQHLSSDDLIYSEYEDGADVQAIRDCTITDCVDPSSSSFGFP